MRRSLCLSACLVTTASLWAQGTLVSPPALATVEGAHQAYAFLYYSSARHQHAEGELKGRKLSLSEVAWRLDNGNRTSNANHSASTTTGRKWTKVTLNLADTDWTKMTTTFTRNQFSTPVEVFNNAYSVPTFTGTPFFKPDKFGGKYAIPFKSPYAYSGSQDLLLDWLFLGGTMDNNVAWSTSRVYRYHLDGNNPTTTYTSPRTNYPAANNRCRDTVFGQTSPAYTYATLQVHGITHGTLQNRDKAHFQMYSYYTAPNARIITGIAFAGVPNGINLGARCNSLYLNLNLPWLALGRVTSGSSAYSGVFTAFVPWEKGMANLQIWVQTAWADSKINVFSLTRAMKVMMPADKPRPRRVVVTYHYTPTATRGFGPYLNNYPWMPITRYTHK